MVIWVEENPESSRRGSGEKWKGERRERQTRLAPACNGNCNGNCNCNDGHSNSSNRSNATSMSLNFWLTLNKGSEKESKFHESDAALSGCCPDP